MRHTPRYLMTEPDEVRRLIRKHPWATFVSATSTGLVASHYPALLDESSDEIAIFSHFGRPDDELHEVGRHQILVIVQGPHDYVSPSWYDSGELVPTWNHVTAHLYGTPQLLDPEENYQVLDERPRARPDCAYPSTGSTPAPSSARTRPPEVVSNIIEQLAKDNPALAQEMSSEHPSRPLK